VECDGNEDDLAITASDGGYVCYSVATEADAMLIAAAPELLDALYSSLASLRWLTEWRTHDATACDQEIEYEIGRIAKLIATAEGRSDG
jgi:hypothetical protein